MNEEMNINVPETTGEIVVAQSRELSTTDDVVDVEFQEVKGKEDISNDKEFKIIFTPPPTQPKLK